MLCLGIDPGTAVTGYGVVRSGGPGKPGGPGGPGALSLVECGVIRTRPRDELAARLTEIFDGIRELILRHSPSMVAVEDVFYQRNVRTTVTLGHARGVILLAAQQSAVPIREYAPADIKKAIVGNGAATKEQVQFMLTQLLRLRHAPEPSDAADGVAAAVTCLMRAHIDSLVLGGLGRGGASASVPPA
ncbi:MAG TPA: crossover junction endodeoxyribonuclease RuvC [Gemmatimonadaceae bacterium]|nr:crossover junction endodeoxyribonuclease RuvC [Gemmatimonadaceae bacterium]